MFTDSVHVTNYSLTTTKELIVTVIANRCSLTEFMDCITSYVFYRNLQVPPSLMLTDVSVDIVRIPGSAS